MTAKIDIQPQVACTLFTICKDVLRGCRPIVLRYQDAPTTEDEQADSRDCIKSCCKSYGLSFPGISKDFSRITGRKNIDNVDYRVEIEIKGNKNTFFKIGTID